MTRNFNRRKDIEKRRILRNNMTKPEIILWSKLKNRQMDGERFLRQYGVEQYVLDFYCPRLRLAIEVDGASHLVDGADEYDKDRQEHIEAFGIQFLRFTNKDVNNNLNDVCDRIFEKVEQLKSAGE